MCIADLAIRIDVGDGVGDGLLELVDAALVDGVGARRADRLDGLPRGAFDRAQQMPLARRHEQNRLALAPGAPGAADAVHVGFGVGRDVVVENVADALHVQSARGDVGGHENIDLTILEARHGAFAFGLLHVAVECTCGVAAGLQLLGQFDGHRLGAREHDHAVEVLGFKEARQRVELVQAADQPVALANVGAGGGLGRDRDLDRRIQVCLRDAPDHRGHRRRKQRNLTRFGNLFEHPFDIVDEAHAQHLVGLVEHQVLELVETQRAALDVIDHAPRRADHDLCAALERLELRRVALSAVDRHHMKAGHVAGVFLEGLRDLDGEFARRRQHQCLRRGEREIEHRQDR